MHIKMRFSTLIVAPLAASFAAAMCPGFNYGIGEQQALGDGVNRWTVYGPSCHAVDRLTTSGNPCTQGIFGCSPPPIIVNRYTNTVSGLSYSCRRNEFSGTCGSDVISVCCRNDVG
ncbi:hypothetical protein BKA70DRAFT_1425723 [Coprinopsis sp. MPI-PUGE-AT-0042]|nr:hypothetical protein BKA70DRAFT_1425723 [Coprinopsis sp. MPI-PUGE-AT-0042]